MRNWHRAKAGPFKRIALPRLASVYVSVSVNVSVNCRGIHYNHSAVVLNKCEPFYVCRNADASFHALASDRQLAWA